MNPFNSSEAVNIDGIIIQLPILEDGQVENSPSLIFQKPKWIPDEEANVCLNCQSRFTHIRRRHHCRNCGKIFCSKCCSEKMCLPHYGLREPEKVCNSCVLIAGLMSKSMSVDQSLKQEAVINLADLVKNIAGLCKVIECGGVHVMFSLAIQGDTIMKGCVASAIHNIAQNMNLNAFLINAGCLKVIKNIFSSVSSENQQLLSDSLSALQLLCHDHEVRIQVLKEGMLDSLLLLVNYTGIIAVLSARVLLIIIKNFDYHEFILQNHRNLVPSLLKTLQGDDLQMQSAVSRMLVYLTASSEDFRYQLSQEDAVNEYPLLYLLKYSNQVILSHTACIVSNLSIIMDQNSSQLYISAMCELLDILHEESGDVIVHIGRGLANFAEHSENAFLLIPNLRAITTVLLKSEHETNRFNACRLIARLLSVEIPPVLQSLSQSGMEQFLETIFGLTDLPETLNKMLMRKVSRLSIGQ